MKRSPDSKKEKGRNFISVKTFCSNQFEVKLYYLLFVFLFTTLVLLLEIDFADIAVQVPALETEPVKKTCYDEEEAPFISLARMVALHKGTKETCEVLPYKTKNIYFHGHARWFGCLYKGKSPYSNFTSFNQLNHVQWKPVQGPFHMHRSSIKYLKSLLRPTYAFVGTKGFCKSIERYGNKVKNEGTENGCISKAYYNWQCDPKVFTENTKYFSFQVQEEVRDWYPDLYNDYHNVDIMTVTNAVIRQGDVWGCSSRFVQWEPCGREKRKKFEYPEGVKVKHMRKVDKVFVISSGGGYYHFINEALPRLAVYLDEIMNNPSIKIYLNYQNTWADGFLELLGISKSRYTEPKQIFAKFAWIPEGTFCCCTRRVPLIIASNALRAHLPPSIPYKEKHILVLKRKQNRRWINNHDDLLEIVKSYGHVELFDDTSDSLPSLKDTARLFRNSKIVVGMFGAGLSNMIFCDPGTAILEVTVHPKGNHYLSQGTALGLRYYGIAVDWDLNADMDELVVAMNYITKALDEANLGG